MENLRVSNSSVGHSVTRCENKKVAQCPQKLPKRSHRSFYYKRRFSKSPNSFPNIMATLLI